MQCNYIVYLISHPVNINKYALVNVNWGKAGHPQGSDKGLTIQGTLTTVIRSNILTL